MAQQNDQAPDSTDNYTAWSVFRVDPGRLPEDRSGIGVETEHYLKSLADQGITVRGVYNVAGLRADADYMIWWHAEQVERVQAAYTGFRRTPLGAVSTPVWSQVALHRPSEFAKSHVPAFLSGEPARKYVCVYPFVRSYEWYLLPDDERRQMLAEHGKRAYGHADVRGSTVTSFALGDYEWILALEANELHFIVDLMRDLRATEARRHVREEIPFYTGTRISPEELVRDLP